MQASQENATSALSDKPSYDSLRLSTEIAGNPSGFADVFLKGLVGLVSFFIAPAPHFLLDAIAFCKLGMGAVIVKRIF